jgi:hypothetical protein
MRKIQNDSCFWTVYYIEHVPLRSTITATSAIAHAVRAGAMPSQPNEKTAIMSIVCWPPIHGRLKESFEVGLDFVPIQLVQGIRIGLLDLKVRIARERYSTREGTLPNIDCQEFCGLPPCTSGRNERGATIRDRRRKKGVACAEKGGAERKVEQHM